MEADEALFPAAGDELARILETMPAGFCFLDPQWRFRRVNAMAVQLLALPRERVLGHTLWEVLPGMLGTAYESAYRSAMASGEPVTFEAPSLTGPGWFEVRAWPAPEGLAIYSLDISERRRAREAADRAGARLALLASVTTELSGALDGESALGRLARLVVPTLTEGCIVTVVDRDGHARDVGSWHADPARRALMARYAEVRLETLPPASPVGRALHAGTAATEPVAAVLPLMPPGEARDLLTALRAETAVVLPLATADRTVGVLTMYHDAGRRSDDEDMLTAQDVAAQAARAVDRVHRQSQQAQLAEGLQRSLLTEPPAIPGATVVARYVPAAEAARVGGDWYDAFLLRTGAPVLVIGDVVGHDTAAAAIMGQLRGLLRGIAHHSGAGPAGVLHGLDQAIASMHPGTMATAAVARLEPAHPDGPAGGYTRLRWANAGHPPPMLLGPDGDVRVLQCPRADLLLGVDATAARAEPVVPLAPGTTVLLYTDGLIERRGESLDTGIDRLGERLTALAGAPLDQLCDRLLTELLDGTPEDDVALVALTVAPAAPLAG